MPMTQQETIRTVNPEGPGWVEPIVPRLTELAGGRG
jgi:hypothetical protein